MYLDGIWLKRSWGGEVRNVAVLVAIGVNGEGFREMLGMIEGAKEDAASWRAFLAYLKGRAWRCRADRLGQLPGPGRDCRRVLPRGALAALHGALLSQRLQARADRQAARGGGDAQGDPRPGGPCQPPSAKRPKSLRG